MKSRYFLLGVLAVGAIGLAYAQQVVIPVPAVDDGNVMGPVCTNANLKTFEVEDSKKSCGLSPCFHPTDNYIMCSARRLVGTDAGSPRCGSFVIKPKVGDIRVQAAKMKYNIWSKQWEPGKVVSWDETKKTSWVKIPAAGKKVFFARPGLLCRNYWAIYCTSQMVGTPQIVDCKKVAEIKSVVYPQRCRVFKSKYKPLNLRADADERPAE